MSIPTPAEAQHLLEEAERLNPGPWAAHSRHVAQAARNLGERLPGVNPDQAAIFGLLHDIGRRVGVSDMRHVLDGYHYLAGLGYEEAARYCLTHSYPIPDAAAGSGCWDGTPQEFAFVQAFLDRTAYTLTDRLIQLADALALPSGFCLIEKRLFDVSLRHGFNEHTQAKWRAFLQIQRDFEAILGGSIYDLLPGVIENTFKALD